MRKLDGMKIWFATATQTKGRCKGRVFVLNNNCFYSENKYTALERAEKIFNRDDLKVNHVTEC